MAQSQSRRHSPAAIELLGLTIIIAATVISQWQHVAAIGDCPLGIFDDEKECVRPLFEDGFASTYGEVTRTANGAAFAAGAGVRRYPKKQPVVYTLSNGEFTAPFFRVTATVTDARFETFVVHVFEDNFLVNEFQFTQFESKTLKATGSGNWSFAITQFGDSVTESSNLVAIEVFCQPGDAAIANGGTACTVPPPAEDKCQYNTNGLDFNPWERWNAFSIMGDSYVTGNSIVQGRVACVGDLEISSDAAVHTEREPFIGKKVPSWSISCGEDLDLIGNILVANGGVEALEEIESADLTEGPQTQVQGPIAGFLGEAGSGGRMSADLNAAAAYFIGRSRTWSRQAQSVIKVTKARGGSDIRVRLHGKVNVVNNITAADLVGADTITLEGSPVGTVIINIAGQVGDMLRDIQVFYVGADGQPTPPTFGRVLLNFYEARYLDISQITLGKRGKELHAAKKSRGQMKMLAHRCNATDASSSSTTTTTTKKARGGGAQGVGKEGETPTHVSILAPFAFVDMQGSAKLNGNLIASSFGVAAQLGIQPFGSAPGRLNPVPPKGGAKTWSVAGRLATLCLWHTL